MSPLLAPRAHGLLWGYHFPPQGQARPVTLDDALALGRPAVEGAYTWLHFDLADAATLPWMRKHLALPEAALQAIGQGSRSTRIEDEQGLLLAVINDFTYEYALEADDIGTLWLVVTPSLVLSARLHPLRTIDRLREAVRQGVHPGSPVDLLNHLLHDQARVLVEVVRQTTARVDGIEDQQLQSRSRTPRAELGRLRRVLVRLQRLLAPEPAALFRLLRQPPAWVSADDLEELRQANEETALALRDLAALQERIKLLQEDLAAQIGEQTNRSLFTLTMVTVLALPINITAGFFGMNVGGIPLADHPAGFWMVVAFVAAFTALAAWLAFRHRE